MKAGLIVAVGLVAVLALGSLSSGADAKAVLSVPNRGEALATHLPDGTPVFVVHTADDDIAVVEAENPNRPYNGLRSLVVWCPSAGGFGDGRSRFRSDGSLFASTVGDEG